MSYLFAKLGIYLFIAGAIGFLVGWLTCERADRPDAGAGNADRG